MTVSSALAQLRGAVSRLGMMAAGTKVISRMVRKMEKGPSLGLMELCILEVG
jgi:hypothetical protein